MILYTDATIVTNDEHDRVVEGCVGVEGERIAYVGPLEGAPRHEARVSLGGKVVMPGGIVAHTHLYGFLARGLAPADSPRDFPAVLREMWWRLDEALTLEDVYWSAMGGALEALLCGTTTLVDHHASPSCIGGSLQQVAAALGQVGIRGVICYEISDRGGHQKALEGLEENLRAVSLASTRPGWLAARMGLHASFTLEDATLDAVACQGIPIHVHLAEDAYDVTESLRRFGLTPLERLERRGLLTEGALLAHGVHLTPQEWEVVARSKAFVVHNPRSNMNNGVGWANVSAMLRAGVRVALGTDGMGQDPGPEVTTALLVARHQLRDPSVGFLESKAIYCRGNADLASEVLGVPLGRVAAGAAADFVVRSYDPPTPLDSHTWWTHYLFGLAAAPVDRVVVGGRELVRHGEPLFLDPQRIRASCREQARRLWARW